MFQRRCRLGFCGGTVIILSIYLLGLAVTLIAMGLKVVDFSLGIALIWPLYWAFAALLYVLYLLGARFGQ